MAVVDRHRIAGLVTRALSGTAPGDVNATLAERARVDTGANLRATAAIADLERQFDQAGLRRLHLKGLTLSALAYGDPFLKASADMDLLVDLGDIPAAATILVAAGFALTEPGRLSPAQLARWHRRHKETVWFRASDGVAIDLHSRLADSPALLPLSVEAPSQWVEVGPSLSLATFGNDDLLAYLAVHGASSCWFRLKWIADFAALMVRNEARPSVEDRSMAQAMLLSDALFGIGLEPKQRDALLDQPAPRHMLGLALAALAAGEPTGRRFGTVAIHRNQVMMKAGLRFGVGEAWRQVASAVSSRLAR